MAASWQPPASWEVQRPAVMHTLQETFGFSAFQGVQEAAVRAAMEGRDALVLMPTGGGKSLCYALPAAVSGGLVLVVSPLIALMQDQVANFRAKGLGAEYLSSTLSASERRAILERLTPAGLGLGGSGSGARSLALLYVTPELLATDSFSQRLASLHQAAPAAIKLLAIDEAHCVSVYGHDFRPTYRQLSQLRARLRGVACMALTATATAQVQADIVASLRLHQPLLLAASFNRPNIHYTCCLLDVTQPGGSHNTGQRPPAAGGGAGLGGDGEDDGSDDAPDVDHAGFPHLLQLLKPHGGAAAAGAAGASAAGAGGAAGRVWPGPISIVYALKRATVDALARRLSGAGIAVAAYHAALPAAVRADVLQRWRDGALQCVCASVAFGMGVDKADIELVVHYNLPRSIDGFYQESGRAGRDGRPARSVLFYAARDRRRLDFILQHTPAKKAARARKKQAGAPGSSAAAAAPAAAGPSASDGSAAADSSNAAAALRAFGEVVALCCEPGCRRARLLRHFGEQQPQQQQQQQQRCCDFCDSPGEVEAAVARLREAEAALLQQHRSWGGQGAKRRRGEGGTALPGLYDSEEEQGGSDAGSGSSEEGEPASDEDAATAAAVAAAAAAQRGGSKGAKADATAAFLDAMLAAEEAQERKTSTAAAGSSLEQRLAGKPAAKAAGLTDSVRAGRRAKLAALLASNSHLAGCTQAAAEELAQAADDAAAAAAGGSADVHRAQLSRWAASAKAACSWLELPDLSLLHGAALQAALKQGVEHCTQQAAQLGAGTDAAAAAAVVQPLQRLAALAVTVAALQATGAAAPVKRLRKHTCPAVAEAAGACVAAWRGAVS